MTRKHFAVAVVLLALAWVCQPFESRAGEFLSADDALTSTMPMEFIAAGPQGGPLNPATRVYYFQNKSGGSVIWRAAKDATWLNLNVATTGTLAAGKVTSVTLSFSSAAASMAPGVYRAKFTFTNTNSTEVFTRKVQLTILPPTAPLVYYKLDETTGTSIIDYSGCLRNGTMTGGAGLSPFAKYGLSSYANLTGAQGTVGVQTPALNLYRNTFTQCLWVYPTGTMVDAAGLWVHRGGNTVAGLQWRNIAGQPTNQLGYNWNDDANNYNWASGLVPPMNQWSFVALVVTPDNATIWLYDGVSWRSAVHTLFHDIEEFNTTGYLGYDSNNGARITNGYIDDAQEFGYALSFGQLNSIATLNDVSLIKASNPWPANGGIGILSKVLHWTPAPAGTYDAQVVYAGTFFNTVNTATTVTSSVGQGITSGATMLMKSLNYSQQYYWRVDTVKNGVVTKGDVWSFQTGPNPTTAPAPVAWYRLDDTTGTVVADAARGASGNGTLYGYVYKTGKARGNARWVAGRNDGGLHLDRLTTTSVAIPALNVLTTNTMTFSAWIKPNATSIPGSTNEGIIIYGTGTTSSGLTITNKGDLGGLWNGNPVSSNGLIPSLNMWNFVAMTVSNSTITLYLNDGRGLGTQMVAIPGSYNSISFDGVGRIGYADIGRALNHFYSGDIDDVRVYKGTLTTAQVYGAAETATPNLPDPATAFGPAYTGQATTMSWTAANAQVHDVYLNITNLTDAPGTPTYVGTVYGPPVLGYTMMPLQKRFVFALDESNTGGVAASTANYTVRTVINAVDKWINYLN